MQEDKDTQTEKAIKPFKKMMDMDLKEINDFGGHIEDICSAWELTFFYFLEEEDKSDKRLDGIVGRLTENKEVGLDSEFEDLQKLCNRTNEIVNEFTVFVDSLSDKGIDLNRADVDKLKKIGKKMFSICIKRKVDKERFLNRFESNIHGAIIH